MNTARLNSEYEDVILYLKSLQEERPTRMSKTKKGAQAKQKILDACYLGFEEFGHKGLSIAKVAAQAGMTKGHITYYYKSKADLLADMFNELLGLFVDQMLYIVEHADGDPRKALEQIIDIFLADGFTRYRFYLQTYGYIVSRKKIGAQVAARYNKYWITIEKLLQLLQPKMSHAQVQEMTMLIRSMNHGVNVLYGMYVGNDQALKVFQDNLRTRIWQTIDGEIFAQK